jgi:pyruvate-formate lyase
MDAARKEFDLIDKELFGLIQKQLKNVKNSKNVKKEKKPATKELETIEMSKNELKAMGYENDPAIHRICAGILKKKK